MARWLARLVVVPAALLVAFCVGTVMHAPVCYPFDWAWNLGGVVDAPEHAPPDDGRVRVVFLQHGMWRTSRSLDRLERSLRALGYEVHNPGYPSTRDRIEGHAARLRDAVEARFAAGTVDELYFVGHSMGGLVIEEYLRRDDAREPRACVYVATPHRGAILADRRRHWFLFRLAMGELAAAQLATTDPLHQRPIPHPDRSYAIVGRLAGEGNASIPGPDDGTVGCDEARFDGVHRWVEIAGAGHTSITIRPRVLRQVMAFLAAARGR